MNFNSTSAGKLEKHTGWCLLPNFFVLLVVFFTALLFHSNLAPLEETHWDAPIYVLLSKYAAETNLLNEYHQQAQNIPLGPGDGAHWYFTRIGHVLLLGEVAKIFGNTEAALVAMQWLYRFFTALGITLCIVVGVRLVTLLRSEELDSIWWGGSFIAAVTYVVSDSFRGLQGHLTSEPPAFLILVLFAWVSLRAVERKSIITGTYAGLLLFLLFFIRVDAVLPGVTFLTALLAVVWVIRKFDAAPSIIAAGLVSLALYLLYAWWFSPLVNPQTLLNFSTAAKVMFPGLATKSLFAIVVAGGLLWVGAGICLVTPKLWRDPVVGFALIWLGLLLLPMLVDSFNGRSIQARMAFFIVLPLLVLATEGWNWILRNFIQHQKIRFLLVASGLMLLIALVPHSLIRQESRNWAINHLPPQIQKYLFVSLSKGEGIESSQQQLDPRLGLLVRPLYERWTLDYSKAQRLSDYLYVPDRPAYLLWPEERLPGQHSLQNYIRLLRFFGKKYPENTDLMLTKLPNTNDDEPCSNKIPTTLEPVVYCSAIDSSDIEMLRKEKIQLYILSADQYPMPDMPYLKLKVLLSIPPFVLYGTAD